MTLCQYLGVAVKAGTYRGVSAAERLAERRQRLLDATLEIWGHDVGTRVTMTRICAEAGLTERYFYEQFSGLDEALMATLDSIAAEIATASLSALETPGEPVVRVRAAIAAFVKILTDDPRKGRIAIVEAGALEALRPRRNELLQQFARLAADEARALYPGHPHTLDQGELSALIFIGGLAELVRAWVSGEISTSPEALVDTATRHFVLTSQPYSTT